MTIVKKFALLAAMGTLRGTTLAASNTGEGAGLDVQAGGRAIERGADNVQKKM